LVYVISTSLSYKTWLFGFLGFVVLACGLHNHVTIRFVLFSIRAWLYLSCYILLYFLFFLFRCWNSLFPISILQEKVLFYFIIVTTFISNIKKSCLNKDVIDFAAETKIRWNWIKPHKNYLKFYILVIWSLIIHTIYWHKSNMFCMVIWSLIIHTI